MIKGKLFCQWQTECVLCYYYLPMTEVQKMGYGIKNPLDNFGTVVGENPDCLLLPGTVVGENPEHVCWEEHRRLPTRLLWWYQYLGSKWATTGNQFNCT